jgi:hypothetical protein
MPAKPRPADAGRPASEGPESTDHRSVLSGTGITRVAVVRAVGHDGVDRAGGLVKQRADLGRVAVVGGRQRGGDDGVGGRIDGQMEFSPGPAPTHAMLVTVPFAGPIDLQPRAVDPQGTGPVGRAVDNTGVRRAARRLIVV